jgi:hypothetical protein
MNPVLKVLIRIFIFYIILKMLTFGEVLVFSPRVFHETVHPLVPFSKVYSNQARSTKISFPALHYPLVF